MSTVARVQIQNPYVGPRSFRRDEALYGRDREVQELLDLLIAERIVLLYSPSGAGKTSLLQAALVPALERESFTVRPMMRVSRNPDDELKPGTFNRYVLSALSDLEEAAPKQLQKSPAQLAGMSFEHYLAQSVTVASASSRNSTEDSTASEVLIFDQFEEILTIDPADLHTKRQFFAQVGAALRDRRRWAVFSMREDYIAGLDPYLRLLPTRLRTTYRLDLLGELAARQAIQGPVQALQAGIEFTDSAAAMLVDNLRRIRVQRPDGSVDDQQLGPYVEPVQLQVVCRNLWEKLPPETTQIVGANVAEIGNVDTALADYYAQNVKAAAASDAHERAIRQWVEDWLITEQGIRAQVLMGADRSEGLDNASIWALVNAHLVRGEKRRGATWFELAHDRLIDPVQQDNQRWLEAHLSKLQKVTSIWAHEGQPEGMLLLAGDLSEARQWAAANEGSLTELERKFLQASEARQEAIWRERRQTKRLRAALALAFMLLFLACLTTWRAVKSERKAKEDEARAAAAEADARSKAKEAEFEANQAEKAAAATLAEKAIADADATEAKRQAVIATTAKAAAVNQAALATSGRLAAVALLNKEAHIDLATLLSLEAERAADTFAAREALVASLEANPSLISVMTNRPNIIAAALSSDGTMAACASEDGTVRLWDLTTRQPSGEPLKHPSGGVFDVAFSPDGKKLATAGFNVQLWDLPSRRPSGPPIKTTGAHAVAFSPDGKWLATGGQGDGTTRQNGQDDEKVRLWDVATGQQIGEPFIGHTQVITHLAFSPDGTRLASSGFDALRIWDVASRHELRNLQTSDAAKRIFNSAYATFSSDSNILALGYGGAQLWDLRGNQPPTVLSGCTSYIDSVAFSPDGKLLAAACGDETIHLWNVATRSQVGQPLTGHSLAIVSLGFSGDGSTLYSASKDQSLRAWRTPGQRLSKSLPSEPLGGQSGVLSIVFSPNGRLLASAGADNKVRLWDAATRKPLGDLEGHAGPIGSLVFSPNGELLASSNDKTVRLWKTDTREAAVGPLSMSDAVTGLAFSSDGKWLASASRFQTIIWDVVKGQPAGPPFRGGWSVAFSPNGKLLASTDGNINVLLWDLANFPSSAPRRLGEPLRGHSNIVSSVAFSSGGEMLASGSWDQSVRFWNTPSGRPIGEPLSFNGGGDCISIAFSPDAKMLAAAGCFTVQLWDVATRQALGVPLNGRSAVAFNFDGTLLATGGTALQLWDVDPQSWGKRLCGTANRNLSMEEWQRYMGPDVPYRRTCKDLPDGEGVPSKQSADKAPSSRLVQH